MHSTVYKYKGFSINQKNNCFMCQIEVSVGAAAFWFWSVDLENFDLILEYGIEYLNFSNLHAFIIQNLKIKMLRSHVQDL